MTALDQQTVLVTGATGFLGGHVTRRLAAEGANVRALYRRPERAEALQDQPHIALVQGDLTDPPSIRDAMSGCDLVFHVAAALEGSLDHQRRINTEGTRIVMDLAGRFDLRVVHISSIAVYGYQLAGDVTEETPFHKGKQPYNITKAEAEEVVREVGARRDVRYSILRPGMIYGPGSHPWTLQMARLARRKWLPFVGDGSGCAHPIYVDDVVDLALRLATHDAALGEAFNATPDPAPTWRAFLGAYQGLLGVEGRWLSLSPFFLRILAPYIEAYLTLRGVPQDVPDLIPYVTRRITYKMDKARQRLNWEPSVTLADGVQGCAPYLRERGLLA